MFRLLRARYDPYPLSPFGLAQKRMAENELIRPRAGLIARERLYGIPVVPLTPEEETLLKRAQEDENKVLFEPVHMMRGRRHKRMYGTRNHVLVGYGWSALWKRTCVCGKTVISLG